MEQRQSLISGAKEMLAQRQFDALHQHLDVMANSKGMGLETLILMAESFKAQNRPLGELRACLKLCDLLPPIPVNAVHFYALGDLLEDLGEPARAREAFKGAIKCDPTYRDASERSERLSDAGGTEKIPHNVVRDDLCQTPKAVAQEIEKLAILGQAWVWPVTLKLVLGKKIPANIDFDVLKSRMHDPGWLLERDVPLLSNDGATRNLSWLRLNLDNKRQGDLCYTLSLTTQPESIRLAHRLVAWPPDEGDPNDVALYMAKMLQKAGSGRIEELFGNLKSQVEDATDTAVEAAAEVDFY